RGIRVLRIDVGRRTEARRLPERDELRERAVCVRLAARDLLPAGEERVIRTRLAVAVRGELADDPGLVDGDDPSVAASSNDAVRDDVLAGDPEGKRVRRHSLAFRRG